MTAVKPFHWARPPQLRLALDEELIVDNFAGGGGASMGIEQALGRPVDIAINHDPEALAMHQANHPHTRHYREDVFSINPRDVTGDRPVGLAWFSPDCRHHSKAKGGKPVSRKVRGLAWVAVRWAKAVRPRVIILENVEEFQDWGPLLPDGTPCPSRKGTTFRLFVRELEKQGYTVDWRELRACDYGAPTIRKRLFLIARNDGLPIVWPKQTHGPGRIPYHTSADCMDWTIPARSIFDRHRPLADNTLRRIAHGIQKFVIERTPYLVPAANVTGFCDRSTHVAAFLAKHYTGVVGTPLTTPVGTVTTRDHHSLVAAHLVKLRGTCRHGQPADTPVATITAGGNHLGEVRAFLVKYYGTAIGQSAAEPLHTITTKHRMGLVMVAGEPYQIADIGMRMLKPRELFRAQGFPDFYVIDPKVNGRRLPEYAQVRMCGNSVPPPLSGAVVGANYSCIETSTNQRRNCESSG